MKSMDIKTSSELHRRIVEAVNNRQMLSERDMGKRYEYWEKSDKEHQAYIHEKDADALRRTERTNDGEPQYTTLQIPYSYGLLMSAHTYWSSVFLSRAPVLQFTGRHGEAEQNVQAVEALMDYQTQVGGHLAPYYVWLFDAGKYGLGVMGSYWEKEISTSSQIVEEQVSILGIPIEGKTTKKKVTTNVVGYEGNKLFNVRPYDYLPDPRVPLTDPNRGEYCGRRTDLTMSTIVRRGLSGQYINVDAVKRLMRSVPTDRVQYAGRGVHELPDTSGETGAYEPTSVTGLLPAVELVITLIPSEWGLGSTEYPEKWVFTVVDKKILVEAHPLGYQYDRFPYYILESEIEGYSIMKRGLLDTSRELNYTLEWLINTHFYNVRKSLNGEYIFDPSRIVAKDLLEGKPGKRIRIRPEAYGQDVRTMITTLSPDAAVTQQHLRDATSIIDMMQMSLGINDTVTGAVNPGGRKTATEIRASTTSSINRMKTLVEYMSAIGFSPAAQSLLRTTQQLYTSDKKFRIVGDMVANPIPFVTVTPDLIAGAYDFTPVDGTLPIDRFALVNMWANLLTQMRNYPQVAQQYNIGDIFAWVAQLGGLKNIKQFRIQAGDQGMMEAQAQQGNLIPIGGVGGAGGANAGAATRGGDRNTPRVPGITQLPGMGQAG